MQEGKEWKLKLWKNGSVLLCLTSQITTEQMTISISNKSLSQDSDLLFMFLTRFPPRECNFSNFDHAKSDTNIRTCDKGLIIELNLKISNP